MSLNGDDHDFEPRRVQLETRAPASKMRALLWLLATLTLALGLGAWFGRVDSVTTAPGRLIHRGDQRLLRAPEPARVAAVRVTRAMRVRRGTVLIELRNEALTAEHAEHEALWSYQADEAARLQTQLDGLDRLLSERAVAPRPESGFSAATAVAAPLAAFAARLREADAAVARTGAETAVLAYDRRGLAARIRLYREQLTAWTALAADRRAPALDGAELRQRIATSQAELEAVAARAEVLRRAQVGALAHRAALIAETRGAWQAARRTAATRAAEAAARVAALGARVRALAITAPIDGVVLELAVNAVGDVVQYGDLLATVVPDREPLRAEVWVRNRDAARIAPGQHARLKLDSYPFTRHGTVAGVVEEIAADAVDDGAGAYVYRAVVRLEPDADGRGIAPRAGMTLVAEIANGRQRLAHYVLAPLLRYRAEAFTEP